jgi:hypothetical protein
VLEACICCMLGADGANGFLPFFLRWALPLPLTACSNAQADAIMPPAGASDPPIRIIAARRSNEIKADLV